MAIPDHVKKQAMDAVSNKVTTAQIRLYCNNDQPAVFNSEHKNAPAARGPIPDHVKKQAMDAISWKGTQTQIRMIEDKDSLSPVGVPSQGKGPLAEKIARMHQLGHGAVSVHQETTKDRFLGDRYG
jgi:hypothetical protein